MLQPPRDTTKKRERGARLTCHCPVKFEHLGHRVVGNMHDLTAAGAGLNVEHSTPRLTLTPGEVLSLDVHTPLGPSSMVGTVQWTRAEEDHVDFGVSSLQLGDHLKSLASCPF